MKKLICFITALMILFAVACSEPDVSNDSSLMNESAIDTSDDINSNVSTENGVSEPESSVSDEVSDETSFPYVFVPSSEAKGYQICDHGAVFKNNWFHYIHEPLCDLYDPEIGETAENAGRTTNSAVLMSVDEYEAWYSSETPDEYKFECNIHDPDEILDDTCEGLDPEAYKSKNVVMFVRQFNVDKEELRKLYYERPWYYSYHFDFDVLFDWEYQDACEWYLDYYNKNREILEAKEILSAIRSSLIIENDYIGDEKMNALSFVQLICELDVPREEMESRLELCTNFYSKRHNEKTYYGEIVIDFKLDDVYNRSDEFMELVEKANNGEIYPREIDDWFIDIQYNNQ